MRADGNEPAIDPAIDAVFSDSLLPRKPAGFRSSKLTALFPYGNRVFAIARVLPGPAVGLTMFDGCIPYNCGDRKLSKLLDRKEAGYNKRFGIAL